MVLASMEKLPRTRLGRTDMEVTRVGFGAWAIGGDWLFGWGEQDDNASIAAIRHAVTRGVNWIDTAAVYGFGHSEEVVGRALKEIPAAERPYVFTKCGLVRDPENPEERPHRVGTAESLRGEVEGSLKRLGVERIDLMQMHWPTEDGTAIEDYWQTLLDLKREGKLGAVGLSNHDASQLEQPRRSATWTHAAAVLGDQAGCRRGRAAVVRGPRDRRHRLQPDAVGPAQRTVLGRAGRGPAGERLALAQSRIRR